MKLQLPGVVVAGLYKDALVIAENAVSSPKQRPVQITEKSKWFLGDNKKNILILLKDNNAVFINDEWLATLSKLLAACKLNIGDVAIVNLSQHELLFSELKTQLQPTTVFMFDITSREIELPFSFPYYQLQQHGDCILMTAPGVTLSAGNTEPIKAEKRKLWEKLKQVFNV